MTEIEKSSRRLAVPYPWQDAQWQHLLQQSNKNTLPHALLFTGQVGIGKRRLAMTLAQHLLCEQQTLSMACGKCRQCQFNLAETHPDLLVIEPEESGKAIKIDQIRKVAGFVAQTAQQGHNKVIVIEPSEAMNVNAANALLKNLEEPTPNTTLILVSHNSSAMLATIRSRCQQISFSVPSKEIIMPWMQQRAASEPVASLNALLALAGGAPLEALQLLEWDALEQRSLMVADLTAVIDGSGSAIAVAADWKDYELLTVLDWLQYWMADIAKLAAGADTSFVQNQDLLDLYQLVVKKCAVNKLFKYADKLIESRKVVLSGTNPNKHLLLEDILISWSRLGLG